MDIAWREEEEEEEEAQEEGGDTEGGVASEGQGTRVQGTTRPLVVRALVAAMPGTPLVDCWVEEVMGWDRDQHQGWPYPQTTPEGTV